MTDISSANANGLPKSRRSSRRQPVTPAAFNRFIDQCLQPLPQEQLADRQHNRDVRETRSEAWRRARSRYEYEKAWIHWAEAARWHGPRCGIEAPEWATKGRDEDLATYRAAVVALVRTPVGKAAELTFKRTLAKDYACSSIKAEVDEIIAADEAFLAAHPVQSPNQRRRPSQPEQRQ